MADTARSALLRNARTRALARLRAENNMEYQRLFDEEIAAMGGVPRLGSMPYRARNPELKNRYESTISE